MLQTWRRYPRPANVSYFSTFILLRIEKFAIGPRTYRQPSGLHQITHSGAVRHDNGLQSVSSNIQFTIRQTDVARGRLELRYVRADGQIRENTIKIVMYAAKQRINNEYRICFSLRVINNIL